MNRAYLVTSSESSGTCYLTQMLIDSGCEGKAGGPQPFDGVDYAINIIGNRPDKLVIQRSIPHGQFLVDLGRNIDDLRNHGYYVTILIPVRDSYCQEQSQLKEKHALSHRQFLLNLSVAWREIFKVILGRGVDFLVIPYTSLGRPEYRLWLKNELDLIKDIVTPFIDGDIKYHDTNLLYHT